MMSPLLRAAFQKPAPVVVTLDENADALDFLMEDNAGLQEAQVAMSLAATMYGQLTSLEASLQTVDWENPQHVEMVHLSYNQIMAPVGVVMAEGEAAVPKKAGVLSRAKEAVIAAVAAMKKTILTFLGRAREWLNQYFSKNAIALKFAQKTLGYIESKKGGAVNMEDKVFYPGHAVFALISEGEKKGIVDQAKLRATVALMKSELDPKPVHDVILAFLDSLGKTIGEQDVKELYAAVGKAYSIIVQALEKYFFLAKDGKERAGYKVRVSEDMGNTYFFSMSYPVTKGDRIPAAPVVSGSFASKQTIMNAETGMFAPMVMPSEAAELTAAAVEILETQQKWSNGYTDYEAFRAMTEKLEAQVVKIVQDPASDAARVGIARSFLEVLSGYSTLYHALASLKLDYCSKLARAMVAVSYQSALRWDKAEKSKEPAMPTAKPATEPEKKDDESKAA